MPRSIVSHVPSVVVEKVAARRLAVAAATTPRWELAATIYRLLDQVWPVLRAQGVKTGHNVVVYLGLSPSAGLRIEAGVEVFSAFTPTPVVYESSTPSGRVATAAHIGAYDQMQSAYAALDAWLRTNGEPPAQVQWEVYGDWSDDPNQLRTDIFYKLSPA